MRRSAAYPLRVAERWRDAVVILPSGSPFFLRCDGGVMGGSPRGSPPIAKRSDLDRVGVRCAPLPRMRLLSLFACFCTPLGGGEKLTRVIARSKR